MSASDSRNPSQPPAQNPANNMPDDDPLAELARLVGDDSFFAPAPEKAEPSIPEIAPQEPVAAVDTLASAAQNPPMVEEIEPVQVYDPVAQAASLPENSVEDVLESEMEAALFESLSPEATMPSDVQAEAVPAFVPQEQYVAVEPELPAAAEFEQPFTDVPPSEAAIPEPIAELPDYLVQAEEPVADVLPQVPDLQNQPVDLVQEVETPEMAQAPFAEELPQTEELDPIAAFIQEEIAKAEGAGTSAPTPQVQTPVAAEPVVSEPVGADPIVIEPFVAEPSVYQAPEPIDEPAVYADTSYAAEPELPPLESVPAAPVTHEPRVDVPSPSPEPARSFNTEPQVFTAPEPVFEEVAAPRVNTDYAPVSGEDALERALREEFELNNNTGSTYGAEEPETSVQQHVEPVVSAAPPVASAPAYQLAASIDKAESFAPEIVTTPTAEETQAEPVTEPLFDFDTANNADDQSEATFESEAGYIPVKKSRGKGIFAAAAVALVALVGGAAAFFITNSDSGGGDPVVVAAEEGPVKVVPEDLGGKEVPHQNKLVYDRVAGTSDGAGVQEETQLNVQQPTTPINVDRDGKSVSRVVLPGPTTGGAATQPRVGPRKVKTVTIRPNGDVVTEDRGAAPAASTTQDVKTVKTEVITPSSLNNSSAAPVANTPTQVAGADPSTTVTSTATPVTTVPVTQNAAGQVVGNQTETGQNGNQQAALTNPNPTPVVAADPSLPVPRSRPTALPQQAAAATPSAPAVAQPSNTGTSQPVALTPQPVAPAQPATTTPTPAAPAANGNFMVQLSSQPGEAAAQASFASMQRRFSLLQGYSADIQRADLGSRGVYHRVRVGPFASSNEAGAFCSRLKSAGGDCIVARR